MFLSGFAQGLGISTSQKRFLILCGVFLVSALFLGLGDAWAINIPGSDQSTKLKAGGTLLRLVDTAMFVWGARVMAGLCIVSAGWAVKEQRLPTAVLCVIGAIVIGTSPMWVKNIFDIGGGTGIFG